MVAVAEMVGESRARRRATPVPVEILYRKRSARSNRFELRFGGRIQLLVLVELIFFIFSTNRYYRIDDKFSSLAIARARVLPSLLKHIFYSFEKSSLDRNDNNVARILHYRYSPELSD